MSANDFLLNLCMFALVHVCVYVCVCVVGDGGLSQGSKQVHKAREISYRIHCWKYKGN